MKKQINQFIDSLDKEAVGATAVFFKKVLIRGLIIVPPILLFFYAVAHFPILLLLPVLAGIVTIVYRVKLDSLEHERRWGEIERKYSDLSHRRPQK